MTLYSRYLLSQYFKVWALTFGTCLAFLLVCHLGEIAKFATFGVSLITLTGFMLLQIPFLLPIALPLASLLAAALTMQRLSHKQELTAFRACGFSLTKMMMPLLMANAFLAVVTFYVNSEITTYAYRHCREMIVKATAINPLVMLLHSATARLQGAYVQMDSIHLGSEAANVLVAFPSRRLVLYTADALSIVDGELQGKQTSCISTIPQKEGFDHLVIENLQHTSSPAVELVTLMRTKGWRLAHDHLPWRLLSARENLLKQEHTSKAKRQLSECASQKALRIAIGLMPLTFTLLGFAFGCEPPRRKSLKGIALMTLCTLFTLVGVLIGKKFDHNLVLSYSALFLPPLLIVGLSWRALARIHRGIS